MALENEAAWRLWNRCKAQWKNDWKLEYADQTIVVEAIAWLMEERDSSKQRMEHFVGLARELVEELHALDKFIDKWRETSGKSYMETMIPNPLVKLPEE